MGVRSRWFGDTAQTMHRKDETANLLKALSTGLNESAAIESFLHRLPELLMRHLPLGPLVLFYRDGDGNRFSTYGRTRDVGELTNLADDSNLITCFNHRTNPLVINGRSDMYRILFNRDTDGLIDRLGINLILPIHFHGYHRGVVAARMERKCRISPTSMAHILDQCATIIVPAIEMERLELENDRNHYRLFKFDRLVLLGQMAASIAHELKTPMSTVLLELQELQDGDLNSAETMRSFGKIRTEMIRLNELIESLLSFSRFRPLQVEEVDLKALVESTLESLPCKRIPEGARIHTRFEKSLVSHADRNRLHQVLLNVLFNAFDAAGPGGEIGVRAYAECTKTKRNRRHVIAVSDNGPGIPQKHKNHVLEPFFTTKTNGTGLGLYISYGIMTSLKGDLEIQSSKKGTTVLLVLPGKSA